MIKQFLDWPDVSREPGSGFFVLCIVLLFNKSAWCLLNLKTKRGRTTRTITSKIVINFSWAQYFVRPTWCPVQPEAARLHRPTSGLAFAYKSLKVWSSARAVVGFGPRGSSTSGQCACCHCGGQRQPQWPTTTSACWKAAGGTERERAAATRLGIWDLCVPVYASGRRLVAVSLLTGPFNAAVGRRARASHRACGTSGRDGGYAHWSQRHTLEVRLSLGA